MLYQMLIDRNTGGSTRAFECKIDEMEGSSSCVNVVCGKVTKTLRGMRLHLWLVHGIREQIHLPLNGNSSNPKSQKGTPDSTSGLDRQNSTLSMRPTGEQ